MTDALLAPTDREEALSRIYIDAIAAGSGYSTSKRDFDRDGVDVQIQAGGGMRPSLDVQLKATINLGEPNNGFFRFPLKLRNYELLRLEVMVPRILVVLDLPQSENDWFHVTPEQLVLRKCAYWANLAGMPDTENKESVTISIEKKNRFDVNALRALMERARTGVIG